MIAGIIAGAALAAAPPPSHPSEDPHRYWRLLVFNYTSSAASLSRLEMRETSGGADVATGGSLITVGSWTNAANIFDGNDATFGFSTASVSRTAIIAVGRDFGASSAGWRTIREVVLRNRSDFGTQGPTNMAVQYSDDNSTWATAWCFATEDWSATGTVRTFTKPTPRRRVVFDFQSPPADAGPHGLVLTANGNATVSGGRFVFDGNGDYYANTAVPLEVYKLPWQFELEVTDVLATNGGLNGMVCIGGTTSRFLLMENNGFVQVWVDGGASPVLSASGILDNVTPKDLRLTVDGSAMTLYVDNVSTATASLGGTNPTTDDLYLGADPFDTAGRCMNGGFATAKLIHNL